MNTLFIRRTQSCAKICGMTEIVQNYTKIDKLCEKVQQAPNYAESCGERQTPHTDLVVNGDVSRPGSRS